MHARQHEDTPADKPLILILIKRATIFLYVISLVSLFYWVVGSESSFLDDTQSMLLGIMRISSLGIIVVSGIGFLFSCALAIVRHYRLKVIGILGYLFAATSGAVALILAQTISILSQGLR